jgi:sporulation integral membrane protein YtvI
LSLKTILYSALGLLLLYGLFTLGLPFLLALLLALLLEPLIQHLSRKTRVKRFYSSLFVCTVFVIGVIGVGYIIIAKVSREIVGLAKTMLVFIKESSHGLDRLNDRTQHLFASLPPEYQTSFHQIFRGLLEALQGMIGQVAEIFFNIAKKLPNVFLEVLIVFIALYLISLNFPRLKHRFMQFFDPEVHERVEIVLKNLHHAVMGFIRAQVIISILIYFVVFLGFLVLGISYPSATALLVTIVDILPVLGTGSVIIPMSIYDYLTGNYFQAVGLLIHYAVIITFRRIVEPKIMANAMGIGALSALISMYIGFKLTGFIGLILGPSVVIFFQALVQVGIIKIKIKFDFTAITPVKN